MAEHKQNASTDGNSIMNGHANDSSTDAAQLGNPSHILIIANVPDETFMSALVKQDFETLFQRYDAEAHFYYLRSFHRSRIVFQTLDAASKAHDELHGHIFNGQEIKCYYAQVFPSATVCSLPSASFTGHKTDALPFPVDLSMLQHFTYPPVETRDSAHNFLEPPAPEKQFLISPPSSPPVGWEVINEREPFVNYDLINAIAQMGPGESYELHQGTDDQPSIVVHICDDPEGYDNRPNKIVQTRCPARKPDDHKPE